MRKPIRFLAALFCLMVFLPQAFADGVMARLANAAQLTNVVASYSQIQSYEQAGSSPFVRFEVSSGSESSFIHALLDDTRIVWVEPDSYVSSPTPRSSHGSSVAAIFDRTAHMPDNGNVWEQINYMPISVTTGWTPIRVGIVDTGVSPYQPWITSNIIASASFIPGSSTIDDLPTDLDSNFNEVYDEGAGHGTMVAGIILQLAPATPLVVAKSADSDGNGTAWSVLEGVVFCVENNVKVINMSLGSGSAIVGFDQVVDWADEHGVLIVSPIGNNDSSMALYPSAYSKVVCVSGVTPTNTKASFSNWDSTALVAAPATGIESSWWDGGTATFSGTSLASPMVVGSIAAMPVTITSTTQLRQALLYSGTNIDSLNSGYEGKLGKLLNFAGLYQYLINNP